MRSHKFSGVQKIILGSLILFASGIILIAILVFSRPAAGYAQESAPTRVPSIPPTQPIASATATPFQPAPFTPIPPTNTATPTVTDSPTLLPSSTSTETAHRLPESAQIEGIYGFPQTYNLSCESRSAADFARHYGVIFSELDFLNALPISDNPDQGFVGSPHGYFGQVPPNAYGVHAKPVAKLLRDFGLTDARWQKGMTFEQIQEKINAGHPVIVWIIQGFRYSDSIEYQANNGDTTLVARWEHTAIVIGYNQDSVQVLDNHLIYNVTYERFLNSWGVLNNMGVFVEGD